MRNFIIGNGDATIVAIGPEISRLFGDTVRASLVRGSGCQLVVSMMCDADVCGLIPTTRLKRVFEWGVK